MLVKTLGAETQRTPRSRAATTERESASALPPDVRRWLCLAVSVWLSFWAVPLVRALPGSKSFARKVFEGGARTKGTAQIEGADGEAQPSPHIRRRSRYEKVAQKNKNLGTCYTEEARVQIRKLPNCWAALTNSRQLVAVRKRASA